MQNIKIDPRYAWPLAAVLCVGGLCFTALEIWAPAPIREHLLGANGLLWTVVAALLKSPLVNGAGGGPGASGNAAPGGPAAPPAAPGSGALRLAALAGVTALLLTAGCGNWVSNGRHGLEAAALALNATDQLVAQHTTQVCGSADLSVMPVGPERDRRVAQCLAEHHLTNAADAIAGSGHVLFAAEAALDAAEISKDKAGWESYMPCIGNSLGHLLSMLGDAHVPIPSGVLTALSFFPAGTCQGGAK